MSRYTTKTPRHDRLPPSEPNAMWRKLKEEPVIPKFQVGTRVIARVPARASLHVGFLESGDASDVEMVDSHAGTIAEVFGPRVPGHGPTYRIVWDSSQPEHERCYAEWWLKRTAAQELIDAHRSR